METSEKTVLVVNGEKTTTLTPKEPFGRLSGGGSEETITMTAGTHRVQPMHADGNPVIFYGFWGALILVAVVIVVFIRYKFGRGP